MDNYKSSFMNKSWIIRPKLNQYAQMRLFCFPFAGGGASVYKRWADEIPMGVELCLIQLPARENRIKEPCCTNFNKMLKLLERELYFYTDVPFVFFGHSMGALMSFELARRLQRGYNITPRHLIVSGFNSPSKSLKMEYQFHNLSDEELVAKLVEFKGTPNAVIENKELLKNVLPAVRGDFSMLDSYCYVEGTVLECPVTVYGGIDDELMSDDPKLWSTHTTKELEIKMFPGEHFFLIKESSRELINDLNRILKVVMNKIDEVKHEVYLQEYNNLKYNTEAHDKSKNRGEQQRERIKEMRRK